jgi:hypothetical protein
VGKRKSHDYTSARTCRLPTGGVRDWELAWSRTGCGEADEPPSLVGWVRPLMRMRAEGLRNEDSRLIYLGLLVGLLGSAPKPHYFGYPNPKIRGRKPGIKTETRGPETGGYPHRTRSAAIFTLAVEPCSCLCGPQRGATAYTGLQHPASSIPLPPSICSVQSRKVGEASDREGRAGEVASRVRESRRVVTTRVPVPTADWRSAGLGANGVQESGRAAISRRVGMA